MIKAVGAEQDNPPPEPSGAVGFSLPSLPSVEPSGARQTAEGCPKGEGGGPSQFSPQAEAEQISSPTEIPLLTPEEKRRILARIARVNPLDCFDDTGAFDIARAKRIHPPGAVRHISIHETTRLNAEGQPVTERRINLGLVDPVSALRLDDQLERRRERMANASSSPSDSNSDSPPPHPASPEYAHNLLRQKTKGLDEANHTLALLKKALAEANDRELQLSKELDEKDRQLSETLNPSNGSQTLSKVEGDAIQRDTGCQPVTPKSQNPPPQALSEVEGSQTLSSAKEPPTPSKIKGPPKASSSVERKTVKLTYRGQQLLSKLRAQQTLSSTESQTLRELEELQTLQRTQEIEEAHHSMGQGAFASWLRRRGIDPAKFRLDDPSTHHPAPHGLPPRSPPQIDAAAQCIPRYV